MSLHEFNTEHELYFYHEFIDSPAFPESKKKKLENDSGTFFIKDDFTIYQIKQHPKDNINRSDFERNRGGFVRILYHLPINKVEPFVQFHFDKYSNEKINFLKYVYHEFKNSKLTQGNKEIPDKQQKIILLNWVENKMKSIEQETTIIPPKNKKMKIFISHSHRDQILVDQFVEKILRLGCGVNDEDIFCSSIDGLGIKNGENFREYIRKNIHESNYSFLLISNNYKQSEICLNEMGALWALIDLKVTPILFSNLNFDSLGTLLSVKQAARINNEADLDEIHEDIKKEFQTDIKTVRWNKHKKDFLKFESNYFSEQANFISPTAEEYFNQFIQENSNLNYLLVKARPDILDCKAIFSKGFYNPYFRFYCSEFERLDSNYFEPLFPKKKAFRITKTNTNELLQGINSITGGMVDIANKGAFNHNIDFYKVEFLENEKSEHGVSFKVFCYVNNKWVFIPKPYNLKYSTKTIKF